MMSFVFHLTAGAELFLLISIVWSVMFPEKRVWPSPSKWSWQFWWCWGLTMIAWVGFNILLIKDFATNFHFPYSRLYIGVPLILLGGGFALWGIYSLGTINTLGLKDKFVKAGAYKFSRNPQYTGDTVLIGGIIILSGSESVLVTGILAILCFLAAPLPEEPWLKDQYGDEYLKYKNKSARFL